MICFEFLGPNVADQQRRKKECLERETDSTSSSLSMHTIRNIIENLRLKQHRSSTKKNYYAVCRLFNHFFIRLDKKPNNWEDRITLFAGYLIDNNKKVTTVKSYILAIKAVLKDDNIDINEDRYLLNSLTKACVYQNNHIRTRLPIRKNLLHLLFSKLETIFQSEQVYLVKMYRALFSTTYYGLFCVGEVTLSPHVLKARDVHIAENKKKLKFVLRTSKSHWTDKIPQIIKIISSQDNIEHTKYCPFKLL